MAHPRIVRILGMSPNLQNMAIPEVPVECWPSNSHQGYHRNVPWLLQEGLWTRWFNLHSRAWMDEAYPASVAWHKQQDGSKPFYTQKVQGDIPGSVAFPRERIQRHFATAKGPIRYFTCTVNWLIPFAIMEGFTRIELHGFQLSDKKSGGRWMVERPCFFYWVQRARDLGVEVWYPPEVEQLPFLPGDPDTYDGPLYGYSTKSEPDWDPQREAFI